MLRAYPDIDTAWARLAVYLGDRFQPELTDFETLRGYLDREWRQLTPRFYERSVGYLYDLTHFHYMGVKDDFFDFLLQFANEQAITDLADIGCGIGLDTQALLQTGYQVHGYDLDNPSLAYGRWRFGHDLGTDTQLQTVDQLTGRRHQLAYAVDVLGHTDDPRTWPKPCSPRPTTYASTSAPTTDATATAPPTCTPASTTNASSLNSPSTATSYVSAPPARTWSPSGDHAARRPQPEADPR